MSILLNPIVRWAIFLPGAFAISLLVTLVLRFVNGIWWSAGQNMTLGSAFGEAFVTGITGGIFIYSAAWLAPKGKLIVSVVLAILFALINLISLYVSIQRGEYLALIVIIGSSIGFIYSAYLVSQSPPDLKSNA